MSNFAPLIRETEDACELWMLRAARAERPRSEAAVELAALLLEDAEGGNEPERRKGETAEPDFRVTKRHRVHGRWTKAVTATLRRAQVGWVFRPAWAWLGVGLVLGAAAGSAVTVRFSGSSEPSIVTVQPELWQPLGVPAPQPCPRVTPSVVEPPSESKKPAPKKAHQGSARPKAAASALDISAEVALLDRARAALAKGDTARSLVLLDEHAKRFNAGALAEEANVLRIQALLKAGQERRAEAEAERYLSVHADSPHAKQVRGMIAKASEDPGGPGAKAGKARGGPAAEDQKARGDPAEPVATTKAASAPSVRRFVPSDP
jgi:hypothetical protein